MPSLVGVKLTHEPIESSGRPQLRSSRQWETFGLHCKRARFSQRARPESCAYLVCAGERALRILSNAPLPPLAGCLARAPVSLTFLRQRDRLVDRRASIVCLARLWLAQAVLLSRPPPPPPLALRRNCEGSRRAKLAPNNNGRGRADFGNPPVCTLITDVRELARGCELPPPPPSAPQSGRARWPSRKGAAKAGLADGARTTILLGADLSVGQASQIDGSRSAQVAGREETSGRKYCSPFWLPFEWAPTGGVAVVGGGEPTIAPL